MTALTYAVQIGFTLPLYYRGTHSNRFVSAKGDALGLAHEEAIRRAKLLMQDKFCRGRDIEVVPLDIWEEDT